MPGYKIRRAQKHTTYIVFINKVITVRTMVTRVKQILYKSDFTSLHV